MGGTDYDDSNPAILYSAGWTAQTGTNSQQFMSTSHTTAVKGASATIKFQGTRLILYLTVPQGSGEESINWTLDGGNSGSNTKHRHDGTTFYQDNWYDSGSLSMGTHTFVVSNAEGGSPFVFDKVNVEGTLVSAQPPAPPKPPTTAATPSTTPAPTQAQQQTQVQTVVSTQVQTVATTVLQTTGESSAAGPSETGVSSASASGSSSTAASSSRLSQSRSLNGTGSGTILVSTHYVTTGADGAMSTIHTVTQLSASTSSPSSISATQKPSTFPLAAVIGGVIGALALIVLGLIFLCLIRRRSTGSRFGKLQESGRDMEREVSQRRRPTDISPFHIDSVPALLGRGGADVSRSASNSSGASGNIISEKARLNFADSPSSNGHSGSDGSPGISTTAFNPSSSIPQQPLHEVDAGSYHPPDSNVDTSGMVLAYVPVNHLLQSPRDSRGAPPSYQSAATRGHARPESVPPPLPPLGIINTLNLSTSTLNYVTPVSATTQDASPHVPPARPVSELSTSPRGNEELSDMPWARGCLSNPFIIPRKILSFGENIFSNFGLLYNHSWREDIMQSSTKRPTSTSGLTRPSSSLMVSVTSDVSTPAASGSSSALSSILAANSSSTDGLPSATFIGTPLHIERKSNVIGPAVGGAIGGLVALLLFVAFLLWRKRRRQMSNSNGDFSSRLSGPSPHNGYMDREKSPTFDEKAFQTPIDSNVPILPMHQVSKPSSDGDMFPPESSLSNMFTSSPSSVSHDHSGEGLYDTYTHDPHDEAPSMDAHDVELGFARSAPGTSWATNGAHIEPQVDEGHTPSPGASDYVVQDINAGPRRPHYLSLLSIASLIPSIRYSPGSSTPHSAESQRSRSSVRALPVPPLLPLPSPSTTAYTSPGSRAGSLRRPLPSPNSPSTPPPRQLPSIKRFDSPTPS
ncbi:hypothetical protein D9619_012871 [Psilocybe cf. subviscida]|uniref:Uncharacterized protein n=1 Tax=Psilocybe cf. subviscida TaxID=2480587 RepID=A0A8H5F4Y4_9AGAR|nr:hypothetical protein D9619_012871 [Psilocybe cf. subviscida]